MKKRIDWIDSVKGFAIVCVVFGHVITSFLEATYFQKFHPILHLMRNSVYIFHMGLFFAISGMSFYISYQKDKISDGKKRWLCSLTNLALVYSIWSIIIGVLKLIMSRWVSSPVTIDRILYFWVIPIGPLWYLYVLMAFYLIFYLIPVNKDSWLVFLFLLLVSMVSYKIECIDWIKRLMCNAVFFFLGEMYTRFDGGVFNSRYIIGLSGIATIALCFLFRRETYLDEIPFISTIITLGIVLIILYVFRKYHKLSNNRFLVYLGRKSLVIYLMHFTITTGSRTFFYKVGIDNIVLCLVISFLFGITIPLLIAEILNRMGCYNGIFRPFYAIRSCASNKCRK